MAENLPLPLTGFRVLDLTRALAGPYCTMVLADLGADVIKVEPRQGGDMTRSWGPFVDGISTYYLSINRNKRSLAVDFRSREGLEAVQRLARNVDVFVENFKFGVADEMGLGYDELRADNPRLIYAAISGFGRGGPYETWAGFDQIAQGMSGLMSVTGSVEHGFYRVGIPIADIVAGMWTAIGILGAAVQRRETGKGQRVDTSLLAGLIALLGVQGQRVLSLDERVRPSGNFHPTLAPYGVFQTANGPLNIAVGTEAMWRSFCGLLELSDLAEHPNYRDNSARVAQGAELTKILEERLRRKTKEEWSKLFIDAGIPAGPIYRIDETLKDPHVLATDRIETVNHPVLGSLRQLASAVQLGGATGQSVRTAPPLLGEQSVEILQSFGFAQSAIDDLLARKAVADGRLEAAEASAPSARRDR